MLVLLAFAGTPLYVKKAFPKPPVETTSLRQTRGVDDLRNILRAHRSDNPFNWQSTSVKRGC